MEDNYKKNDCKDILELLNSLPDAALVHILETKGDKAYIADECSNDFDGTAVTKGLENSVTKVLEDSGNRTEFASGAVRDMHEGKGRFDLMPLGIISNIMKSFNSTRLENYDCDIFELVYNFRQGGNTDNLYAAISMFIRELVKSNIINNEWEFLLLLAKHYENGAIKYGENNWQKGIPVNSCIDSALRHYTKFKAGMTDEPHYVAFVWNLITAIYMVDELGDASFLST